MIAILALANGNIFEGVAIGDIDGIKDFTCGEVVFNTAMSGYQEIISDPSYCEQIIMFTMPHIGIAGINQQDNEFDKIWSKGIIVKSLSTKDSNWRSNSSLNKFLVNHNLIGIANVDTRAITHILRDQGSQRACIHLVKSSSDLEQVKTRALSIAKNLPSLDNLDLAKVVCTRKIYQWNDNTVNLDSSAKTVVPNADTDQKKSHHIVVYDFGVKQQILRLLINRHCKVTVVPGQTSVNDVMALNPNGILLSNGPGDPAACTYAINNTYQLIKSGIPIFGICLGFQILALAMNLKTVKMKFGHHGANHPVKDLETGRVLITSQNHGFMAAEFETGSYQDITITHRSLFDNTIQGLRHNSLPIMGFQGHPEASPGPKDIEYLFDKFIDNIAHFKTQRQRTDLPCQNVTI